MGIQGKTPDPKHPGGTTLEQQAQWVTLSTAGNFSYLYAKGQNALRTKKCAFLSACAIVRAARMRLANRPCTSFQAFRSSRRSSCQTTLP